MDELASRGGQASGHEPQLSLRPNSSKKRLVLLLRTAPIWPLQGRKQIKQQTDKFQSLMQITWEHLALVCPSFIAGNYPSRWKNRQDLRRSLVLASLKATVGIKASSMLCVSWCLSFHWDLYDSLTVFWLFSHKMLSIGITDGRNESLSAAVSWLLSSLLLPMRVAQHSADQLRLERWTAERIHRADAHSGLWFQLLPHADRPLHWKRGWREQKKPLSSAECWVLPGCQSRFLSPSIRVYRKRSLGGRKAGQCVCFRGFWHFVINVESICFHKPVYGVSVSPFLVCLWDVHVVARLLR